MSPSLDRHTVMAGAGVGGGGYPTTRGGGHAMKTAEEQDRAQAPNSGHPPALPRLPARCLRGKQKHDHVEANSGGVFTAAKLSQAP